MDQVKFVEDGPLKNIPSNFFKGCLPQILFGPFLNTLSQIIITIVRYSDQLYVRSIIQLRKHR